MTARPIIAKALWALLLTPLFTLLFAGLLTASFALPDKPIVENLLDREDVLDDRRADNGRVIDADTECIGLSVGLYRSGAPPDQGFERAMLAESLYGCDQFISWLKTGETTSKRDYFRYWHGYSVVARPLLSLMPYNDVRGYLFHLSLLLLVIFVWRIGRDFGAGAALAALAPFVVFNAMGYWVVATKAVTWFLLLGAGLFISRRKTKDGAAPLLLFFALGALTAFFDFLTAPALIFAFAAFVFFLYNRPDAAQQPLRRLILMGAFWGAGYAGLWAMKISLAAAVLDLPVWRDVTEAMAFRLRGASEHVETFLPGAALYENIAALKSFWGPVAVLSFIIAPVATKARRAQWALIWREARVFIAIAAIPVLWLEALSNHSQIHAAFTHLNFVPAAMLAGLVLAGRADLVVTGRGSAGAHGPR